MRNEKIFKSNGTYITWTDISTSVISSVRLKDYLVECEGDVEKSVRLYIWNTAVSASFYGALQMLEVTLREALIIQLYNQYGEGWYDTVESTLDPYTCKQIKKCSRELDGDLRLSNFLDVTSTLSFGFWESLINPQIEKSEKISISEFERLTWRPALRSAFPNVDSSERGIITEPIRKMKHLRDQIAHHKPIFKRNLDADYQTILQILGWMSLESRLWVEELCRVPEVLAIRNKTVDLMF